MRRISLVLETIAVLERWHRQLLYLAPGRYVKGNSSPNKEIVSVAAAVFTAR